MIRGCSLFRSFITASCQADTHLYSWSTMVPLQTPGESSHSRSPVMTHHHPHLPPLPTQGLLGSLASGAHYAGALPSHSDDPPLHARLWRARSRDRSSEDPGIELKYREVMEDLQKVSVQLYTGSWRRYLLVALVRVRCSYTVVSLHEKSFRGGSGKTRL